MSFRDANQAPILIEKPSRVFLSDSGAKQVGNSKYRAGFAPVGFLVGTGYIHFSFDFDLINSSPTSS